MNWPASRVAIGELDVAGHDDHAARLIDVDVAQTLDQRRAVHHRHARVAQDDVEALARGEAPNAASPSTAADTVNCDDRMRIIIVADLHIVLDDEDRRAASLMPDASAGARRA